MAKAQNNDQTWDFSGGERMEIARSLAVGDVVEGIYLGYETAMLPNGPCQRHHFEKRDGTRESILGAALLDGLLSSCQLGRPTRLEKTDKLMGRAHVYDVVQARTTIYKDGDDRLIGRRDEIS